MGLFAPVVKSLERVRANMNHLTGPALTGDNLFHLAGKIGEAEGLG